LIDDKYTYPGSGGVLRNSLHIHDQRDLESALNAYFSAVAAELELEPAPQRPDFTYLKQLHSRLFGRVLPWAGTVRDVDTGADGTGIVYCRPEYIHDQARTLFGMLEREDYLRGIIDPRLFADRLADRWAYLSQLHPFRDGNTRSQSLYVTTLATRAGHTLRWHGLDVDELRRLRIRAVQGQVQPLAAFLYARLTPNTGAPS